MNASQAPQLTCWTASLRHKGKVAVTELRWCWLAVCAFPHLLCHLRPESSDPGSLLQPPTVPVSPSAPSTQLPSCQGGELPKANLILLPRLTASLLVASLGTCCLLRSAKAVYRLVPTRSSGLVSHASPAPTPSSIWPG